MDHSSVVTGKTVLDFGAGSGMVGIAALKANASSVLSADIDAFAIAACKLNAEVNKVSLLVTCDDIIGSDQGWDVVLVGDMCYEQPLSQRIEIWLRSLVARGALVLIGDPGRTYLPRHGMEKIVAYAVKTTRELEDMDVRNTSVWRLLEK